MVLSGGLPVPAFSGDRQLYFGVLMGGVAAREHSTERNIEWPTVALILAFYICFAALTFYWHELPWWISWPLAGYLTGLYGSIQHEAIHGHPTASRACNEVLVFPALLVWVPYGRYRDQHLQHHQSEKLTDPYDDPESFYVQPEDWSRLGAPVKLILQANNTLAGRLLIGPAISMLRFWYHDARQLIQGNTAVARAWGLHLLALVPVIVWIWGVCAISPLVYAFAFAYAGTALILLRSYAEHRAIERIGARTIIVETCPALALLFLNNNLHAVHHKQPGLPWYQLPKAYNEHRDAVLSDNGGYFIGGYCHLFTQHLFAAKEPVPHPLRPIAPALVRHTNISKR